MLPLLLLLLLLLLAMRLVPIQAISLFVLACWL
jgi:hypothetical protein